MSHLQNALNTPLSNIIERLQRSAFHAIRKKLIVEGYLPNITTFTDDDAGVQAYRAAIKAIRDTKGFAIEVFNHSSPQAKFLKKIPRIVIVPNRTLPGALGGSPTQVFLPPGTDPLQPGKFVPRMVPPQMVDIQFDIHLISNQAVQDRIMHAVVALMVPKRGYIEDYLDNKIHYFVRQYSYRDIVDNLEGINERIYMYEFTDIFETESIQEIPASSPIIQITVEPKLQKPGDDDTTFESDDNLIVT